MIRDKKSIAVSSLVAIFACLSAAGTEPNDANTPLTFEVSTTELPAPQFSTVYTAPRVPTWKGTVTYAAGVAHNDSTYFLWRGSRDVVARFIEFARSQGISEEQWRFLVRTHGGLETGPFYTPPEDPNASQSLLYAVSLDDAKKMAEAYLQYARDRFKEKVTPIQAESNRLTKQLADEQQKLPEAIQAYEAAKKAFEDLQKQVPYRYDKQALDAAAELDKMINMAQVDIAGIRARIEVIQHEQQKRPPTAVAAQLEIMFIQEAVALQGAQARKNMATTLRKQADSYIDLRGTRDLAEVERDRLTQEVSALPEMIRRVKEKLAATMQEEPKVINNRVFIYPVRQETPARVQP